jgi:hypothetical protein
VSPPPRRIEQRDTIEGAALVWARRCSPCGFRRQRLRWRRRSPGLRPRSACASGDAARTRRSDAGGCANSAGPRQTVARTGLIQAKLTGTLDGTGRTLSSRIDRVSAVSPLTFRLAPRDYSRAVAGTNPHRRSVRVLPQLPRPNYGASETCLGKDHGVGFTAEHTRLPMRPFSRGYGRRPRSRIRPSVRRSRTTTPLVSGPPQQ